MYQMLILQDSMTAGRSIGISNFEGKYLEELETKWEVRVQGRNVGYIL